jgi:hypothetical protein
MDLVDLRNNFLLVLNTRALLEPFRLQNFLGQLRDFIQGLAYLFNHVSKVINHYLHVASKFSVDVFDFLFVEKDIGDQQTSIGLFQILVNRFFFRFQVHSENFTDKLCLFLQHDDFF